MMITKERDGLLGVLCKLQERFEGARFWVTVDPYTKAVIFEGYGGMEGWGGGKLVIAFSPIELYNVREGAEAYVIDAFMRRGRYEAIKGESDGGQGCEQ